MVRGLYTAGTGMLTQRSKMDIISNNLANIETAGFKQDELLSQSFEDMMIKRINDPNILMQKEEVGPLNTGIHIDEIITDYLQGVLGQTDINTDLALQGDGFFVINTPDGERYTRNGSFNLNPDGMLVTKEGYFVQGTQGNLQVQSGDFKVNSDGTVLTDKGITIDKLKIVSFKDNALLRKEGNSLYTNTDANNIIESETNIKQGFIEGSNVDLTNQIIQMIEISRNFESNQKIINIIDGTLDKAVNDIGRV